MAMTAEMPKSDILLYVSDLKKHFEISNGLRTTGYVKALDGVTFQLRRGETLGVVGETGCGKTTLGRTILRLIKATDGYVYFDLPDDVMKNVIRLEEELHSLKNKDEPSEEDRRRTSELTDQLGHLRKQYSLTMMSERKLRAARRKMQPIFQDPFSSLDPRKLIKDSIAEPMKLLTDMHRGEIFEKTKELVESIGLSEDHLYRFPHEFSGGQRQRIGVARAIGIDPLLLVLDEPTSALDVSVQAQILNILKDIQSRMGLSYIFISHHLSVIRIMADKVAVMYLGQVIELAETSKLFSEMLHPYTAALLSAIPVPDPRTKREKIVLEGEIPSPANPPAGCYFHPRCPVAMENCGWSPRDMSKPVQHMLDRTRNIEATELPELVEIILDEPSWELEIVFNGNISDASLEIFRRIMAKEAERQGGVRFKAVKSIGIGEEATSIKLIMRKPDTPHLKEVAADHFVSCLIYDQTDVVRKGSYAEEASRIRKSITKTSA